MWLGVSVEAQRAAPRIDLLMLVPAAVRFLSVEPLIGPLRLMRDVECCALASCEFCDGTGHAETFPRVDWVIVGGESGARSGPRAARECHDGWIASIVRECQDADVPVFVKQLGTNVVETSSGLRPCLRDSHGGDPSEWPPSLRVREFPRMSP